MPSLRAALLAALALPMSAASTGADAHGKRHSHHPRAHVGVHSGAAVVVPRTHVVAPRRHVVPRHHAGIPHRHVVVPHAHFGRPRTFVGLHVGVPVVMPYPVYHYSPPLIAAAPVYDPPVYVERQAPVHDPAASYWYYCRDAEAYFPYVQQCTSPWERVLPHAPPGAPAD